MTSGIKTVIYPVKDLPRAKALYGKLTGVAPSMDEEYYVGFKVGDQDISLDPTATAKADGPVRLPFPSRSTTCMARARRAERAWQALLISDRHPD